MASVRVQRDKGWFQLNHSTRKATEFQQFRW